MKEYLTKNIRNVAILGHLGCGKTSLTESMLFMSGAIAKKGEVKKKTTVSDYTVEEQNRQTSLTTALIPVEWKGFKINCLDTPGSEEFVCDLTQDLSVVKGAIVVVDATKGVEVGTERVWNELRKRHIPTIIYVNKMDKENVDFEKVLDEIRTKLGKIAIPFCYPLGHDNNFDGFVNVVDLKARIFNGKECVDAEIYEDKRAIVMEHHNTICEEVAKTDDELLEKFFSDIPLEREEIRVGLRKGVLYWF